jgi:hypothetical protein
MTVQTYGVVAVVGFLLTGSSAAAQSADEQSPRPLRNASVILVPARPLDHPPQPGQWATSNRGAKPWVSSSHAGTPRPAQVARGSNTGKAANVLLAGFLGGAAGFLVGGFLSEGIRCGCMAEEFDNTVGAPIGAIAGSVLTATYVHRRQHP